MRIERLPLPDPAVVAYVPDRLLVLAERLTREECLVVAQRITGKPGAVLQALLDVAFSDTAQSTVLSAFGHLTPIIQALLNR